MPPWRFAIIRVAGLGLITLDLAVDDLDEADADAWVRNPRASSCVPAGGGC